MVEQLTNEPGAHEHREHQQQFNADDGENVFANGPEQRQQSAEHAAVEGLPGQHFFDFDVAEGLAG
ncbi:hypothetical protein D3C76_1733830 [compost metagenome]